MSETFYGQISIPLGLIDDEVQEQLEKDFNLTHNPECFDTEDGICTFSNAYAVLGMFEELEDILYDKEIPFDRYSDSFFEYRAEQFYYRPAFDGTSQEIKLTLIPDSGPYIETEALKALLLLEPVQAMTELENLIQASAPEICPLTEYIKVLERTETSRREGV